MIEAVRVPCATRVAPAGHMPAGGDAGAGCRKRCATAWMSSGCKQRATCPWSRRSRSRWNFRKAKRPTGQISPDLPWPFSRSPARPWPMPSGALLRAACAERASSEGLAWFRKQAVQMVLAFNPTMLARDRW